MEKILEIAVCRHVHVTWHARREIDGGARERNPGGLTRSIATLFQQ